MGGIVPEAYARAVRLSGRDHPFVEMALLSGSIMPEEDARALIAGDPATDGGVFG